MEELYATHKPVPFGWLLLLQELIAARRVRKQEAWREPDTCSAQSDLHNLAAPH